MNKNILILGSGGREHALGWKLSKSKFVNKIYYVPGNGGTLNNLTIDNSDFGKIKKFALENDCMIVVGPEEPLTKGIVNELSENVNIFGPTKEASRLESSKSFAKNFMKSKNIPTPNFSVFEDHDQAIDYIKKYDKALVIKADGLASGKGVIVCNSKAEAIEAVERIMIRKEFGKAGEKIVVEERLFGNEVSFIGISDGNIIIPVATSQDYKRIYDNDIGPNTGGMGSFSPSPLVNEELFSDIMKRIMDKTINSMRNDNNQFKGFLYAGLMIEKETRKPYVLEFNVRMGDPECQPIMMRLKSDLFPYLHASLEDLSNLPELEWDKNPAICVVMAEKGYPINHEKGNIISGLSNAFSDNIMVFHAGTIMGKDGNLHTNGGRVLGITASGRDFDDARSNAYSAVNKIKWGNNQQYFRTDIGKINQ